MLSNIEERFRSHQGPLTESLVRSPGKFGLGQVPVNVSPDATTSSVCGYCSTGCSLKIHLKDGQAVNLTPDPGYPVNRGMACPKGWEALTPLAATDRALQPQIRETRGGDLKPLEWTGAAQHFCERIQSIQDAHGKDSVAFLSTGQICTEEMALLGVLAKFGMGMTHGDGNTRQCMATAVRAYKESFGFDAPPYTYADFEESDVIVLIGSNLCVAHPIMWQRVLNNPNSPEIIVIDPRMTETAMQATQHVPLRPKSDLALYYGIANRLIQKGMIDQDYIDRHTSEFEAFAAFVDQFDLEKTLEVSGLPADDFERLVDKIGMGKRVSFWWTMGVNQGHEATRTAQAIINLALMTGNMGRPGTGANSITGQCNAMGSRLFSNTTCLPAGRDYSNGADRQYVAETLGIDESCIQTEPGWAYDQIIDGIESGKIKALWVIATNGAHSWIDQNRFRRLMGKLDFLVVQDIYSSTDTAEYADLILPAAGWGEKEGTFINSERRIGLNKKVRYAPGEALSDYSIFRLLGAAWGGLDWLERWHSPEAAFQMLKKLSVGQPCDFSGITDYSMIDESGIQWPFPSRMGGDFDQERRLFEDGAFYTSDQRAKFVWDLPVPPPETVSARFPLELITGRGSSGQWHTQTRTGKSEILNKINPKTNYVEVNPADALEMDLQSEELVKVMSRRGKCVVRCVVTPNVSRGQVFMPMHFVETNRLTLGAFDPHSRQPSYKHCAVRIRKQVEKS